MLFQITDDITDDLVYYFDKNLTDTESRYSTIETELYAVVWAVQKAKGDV